MGLGLFVLLSLLLAVTVGGGWEVLAITWLVPAFGLAWSIPQSLWWRNVLGKSRYEFDGLAVVISERGKEPRQLTLGREVEAIRLVGLPPRLVDIILDKGDMTAFPSLDLLGPDGWIYGPKIAASAADLERYEKALAMTAAAHGVRFSRH